MFRRRKLIARLDAGAVESAQLADDMPAAAAKVAADAPDATGATPPRRPVSASQSLQSHARAATLLIATFALTVSAWSFGFTIDGAVVAPGTIAVENSIKKVQHPTGGVVSELAVVEGQYVKAGDVVVRLDDTMARANLGIVVNELTGHRARLVRLHAERDGATELAFPQDLLARAAADKEIAAVVAGERTVFQARATTRSGQRQQLTERIGQLKQEIRGAQEQLDATRSQTVLARDEMKDLKKLFKKGLVPRNRVSQLEREVMRNEGQAGELVARVAQAQGRISETQVQISQLDRDLASEVAKDIREAETKIAELQERRVAAEDQLRKIDVKAPISGYVLQLAVHTVGGVVSPSEPMMMIVPDSERLIIEVKISPMDVDRIGPGQETLVRLSAFNGHTTPQVVGTVTRVGADLVREPQTQMAYYPGAITISDEEIRKLEGLKLVAGMPAEAFIKTGGRTFASYLFKPVRDQFFRALREE